MKFQLLKHDDIKKKKTDDRIKLLIVVFLLIFVSILTYVFLFLLNISILISHFYYIPVILSCIWWQRKGLVITIICVGLLLLLPVFLGMEAFVILIFDNLLRAMILIIMSAVVSYLSDKNMRSKNQLQYRVRELHCLYGITKSISNPNSSVQEILSGLINQLKCTILFPGLTSIKINFRGIEYLSENFKKTSWKITKEIQIQNQELQVLLYFIEDKSFPQQEFQLLDQVINELKAIFELKLAWLK